MKLVSTLWVSTSLSKSGYLEAAPLLELEDPPAAIGVSKTHALFILKPYTHCSTVVPNRTSYSEPYRVTL